MESAGGDRARWRATAAGFAAASVLGLVLGAIGPFGSYLNGSAPARMAYWVANLWVGWLAFGFSLPRLSAWASQRNVPLWAWTPPAVALLAVLPALLSRAMAVRLWPVVGQVHWLEWYVQCLLISALITAGVLWATHPRGVAGGSNPTSADPRERLPAHLGRTVLCLKMEDHYVRVHTPQGSALVLMSLSQAMEGLKDLEGVQTHRSWWVAREAVTGVVEDGRNLRLSLKGGVQAPVSRTRVGRLREDGWLAGGS